MQNLQKMLPKFSIAMAVVFAVTIGYLLTRGNTVDVEARKISRSELVEAVYATGYVEAENIANLRAEFSGTVRAIGALEGQRVSKGQAIIVFDSVQPRLAVNEARAAVAEEMAAVRDNDLRLQRSRTLFQAGAISRQDFDAAERNSTESREALRQRQMQLKSREDDLKKLEVVAPFSGILTLQNVKEGDYVQSGTLVATVTDSSRYLVVVEVDELDVPRLRTGLKAVIAFDSMPEKRFGATVVRIVPQTDRVTKTSRVYLKLDDSVAAIQGGMTATANIVYNTKKGTLLVSKSSVFEEERQSYVWKVVKGKLKKQPIRTGDSDLVFIEVVKGLDAGDVVVTSPQENYRDGMEARIVKESSKKQL
ncbi:efflux RND transporter periplasmic adaptor subunit [Chlorobaculum sp. MV4-Y]|jgi:RND family efflux transporter MFP subunit|uniref:efflux RND transporter periplasmic adaptor subunit n=1 Tax=Chlorobaculum sp. MV4-Y TaxID=2976335 RepID=UPI0021AE93E4|nr:efflux RND transporter periplasmic adaptor subunit [Chlorobaculum sp. MV4-Y]UWX58048.1 efflux RND transporter periplasmic adaptor subunit [Chlorobaculum sp. MV4-Y]